MNGGFIRSSTEYVFRKTSHFDLGCTSIPDIAYKPIRKIGFPSLQGWFSFWRSALKYYWKSKKYHSFSQNNLEQEKGSFSSILSSFLLAALFWQAAQQDDGYLLFALWHTKKGIKMKSPHVNNDINFAINQKTNKQKTMRSTLNVLILPMLCIIKTISPWKLALVTISSTSRP